MYCYLYLVLVQHEVMQHCNMHQHATKDVSYIVRVPCSVSGLSFSLDNHVSQEDHQQHQKADHSAHGLKMLGLRPVLHSMSSLNLRTKKHSQMS